MAQKENFKTIIPAAHTAEEAAAVYNKYYSTDEQQQKGVLAIEIILK